jgi:hypothetical protein
MEAEVKLEQAKADLTRKSMGVQRDIMEKMLGAALGTARTSVGARRQRGTDVGLMGYERSRMKTRSGMLMSAGPGGVKPLWQRQAEMKQAGKGARRMKPEEEMAAGLWKTAKSTDETAKATKTIADDGHTPGSLYTHDTTTEGLLASILYVATDMAVGIDDISKSGLAKGTGKGGSKRDELMKGIASIQSEIAKKADQANSKAKDVVAASGGVGTEIAAVGDQMENLKPVTSEKGNKTEQQQLSIAKKELAMDKKNLRGLRGMFSDQKSSKKTLEEMVRKGMPVTDVTFGSETGSLGLGIQMPKEITDELAALQENFKNTGDISPGIDYLADSLSKWGTKESANMQKLLDEREENIGALEDLRGIEKKSFSLLKKQLGVSIGIDPEMAIDPRERVRAAQERVEQSRLGRPGKVKTIGDTFKSLRDGSKSLIDSGKNIKRMGGGIGGGLAGGGNIKRMGGGLGAGGKGLGEKPAMIGFDKASKDMASAAKETVLSSSNIADIAANQTSFSKTGGDRRETSWTQAQTQFGAGGSAIGGQGGTAEAGSMRIEGQMTVHFDNQIFKDQVAAVVGSLMKTPDFAKSVRDMAFSGGGARA